MQRVEGPCPSPQHQQLLEPGVSEPPLLHLLRPGPGVCSGGGDGVGEILSRTYLRLPPQILGAQEGKGGLSKTCPPAGVWLRFARPWSQEGNSMTLQGKISPGS